MRKDQNLALVEAVADRLGSLKDRVVFLGGAATGLLLSDPGASPVRPTKDVDVIVEVGSRMEYQALEKELQSLGFKPDQSGGAPLCRWLIDGMILDVMPTDPSLLGFSNRWYPEAMREAVAHRLPGGIEIRVVSAPYFLATKLEAFLGRGGGDFMGSHDLEDVISLLDGREEVVAEVRASTPKLQGYLAEVFGNCLANSRFAGAVQGNLPPDRASQARFPMLMARIQSLHRLS